MTHHLRKLILILHITFSVGWFGAVAGFVALNITGLSSQETQMIRSAYLAMNLITWFVILPFCLGSLLTGLIQSLGTPWGLFRHYWILIKFFLTSGSTFLLLLHMKQISNTANMASVTPLSNTELNDSGVQLLIKSSAALLVLLITTMISVHKPWGMTPYGKHKQQEKPKPS